MSNIKAVMVNDRRWAPVAHKAEPDSRAWTNGGDMLILRYYPLPPDVSAPLSQPGLIWKIDWLRNFWKQAEPVDLHTGMIGTAEYLSQIVKFSFNGQIRYQRSLHPEIHIQFHVHHSRGSRARRCSARVGVATTLK